MLVLCNITRLYCWNNVSKIRHCSVSWPRLLLGGREIGGVIVIMILHRYPDCCLHAKIKAIININWKRNKFLYPLKTSLLSNTPHVAWHMKPSVNRQEMCWSSWPGLSLSSGVGERRAWSNVGMMIRREKPKTLGQKPAPVLPGSPWHVKSPGIKPECLSWEVRVVSPQLLARPSFWCTRDNSILTLVTCYNNI
jgi:hypothetical protein